MVRVPAGDDEAVSVLLVVSDPVSHAARHAGGMTGFDLQAGPGTVTVTVEDASCVLPLSRTADPAQPGGLGWTLVQESTLDVQASIAPDGKTPPEVVNICCPFSGSGPVDR